MEMIDRLGAITVPQIARERSTSRQNIQILVDRLVANGRLKFVSNPSHKRSALVELTGYGRSVLDASVSIQKERLAQLGSTFSPSEITVTLGVLRRIYELLSEQNDQNGKEAKHARAGLEKAAARQTNGEADEPVEEFPINLL